MSEERQPLRIDLDPEWLWCWRQQRKNAPEYVEYALYKPMRRAVYRGMIRATRQLAANVEKWNTK